MEKGILFEKFDTVKISDRFSKREFILLQKKEAGEHSWNEHIKFQLTNDGCTMLDSHEVGDILTVDFNIKGKQWEKNGEVMYFNTLQVYKITGEQNEASTTAQSSTANLPVEDETDDLPF